MTAYDEKELAGLLRALPPPPPDWVEAAARLPRTRRELERVLPVLERQAIGRKAETTDLERAIEAAGLEPVPELVNALRRHLDSA